MSAHFKRRYASLRKLVDRRLASFVVDNERHDVAEASRYVLRAGGKRVRSILTLLSCEAVGGTVARAADAAVAMEMLHNFTLVHDDVMDKALSRRGRATVHTKWDVNSAILAGDVMLGLAYRSLLRSRTDRIHQAAKLFTHGFIEVCNGQALDLEYERRATISLHDYYRMISRKTGALIATATELGAIIGNGTPGQGRALRTFGARIGTAFQIQDDLLDVVGEEKDFGKKIGGDILEGKKTFLLAWALERTRGKDRSALRAVAMKRIRASGHTPVRVNDVAAIYQRCGAIDAARQQIGHETDEGLRALRKLPGNEPRAMLEWLARMLVQRTF